MRQIKSPDDKKLWQTWWLIVGPRLPEAELVLQPNVTLAPLTDQEVENLKRDLKAPPPLNISPPSEFYSVHYPPRDEVKSRYRMQIDVRAEDEKEGVGSAKEIADRIITTLSLLVPGQRYTAEFRKWRVQGTVGEHSNWSETVMVRSHEPPVPLELEDSANVVAFMDTIERDPTAAEAYAHLLAAWRLSDTPGSRPLNRSILQHYVLSIEAIAVGVMENVRAERADQIRLAERTFSDDFSRTLGNRANKPKAIREASTKLREIALSNMIPSFITTAGVLGIAAGDKDRAIDLYKLRSSSLSHPGKRSDDQIQQWLRARGIEISLADALAREFLVKYCAHASKGAKEVRLPAPYFAASGRPSAHKPG